jgi:pilus assembly protein CpaB
LRRRILTIALAVVLAAVGTLAVLGYVHQANERAVQGLKAVSVLVAGSAIPSGTPAGQALRQGWLVHQTLPVASVPTDAIRSITPALAGLVTSGNVSSGAVLTRPMLASAAQVTGGVAIPKGLVAVSVQLCLPEDVAGYVAAGVRVAVFDTYGNSQVGTLQRTCDVSHATLPPGAVHTQLVLPRVEVLSVGPAASSNQAATGSNGGVLSSSAANTSSAASGAVLVTLAVTTADAERLIQVEEAGLPYLALVTPSSNVGFDAAPGLFQQP